MDEAGKALKLQEILQKFIDSVEDRLNDEDPGGNALTAEFRKLRELGLRMREENTHPCDAGKKSFNIRKNRFKDILPFDETRVTLEEIDGEEGSDYINANFILDIYGNQGYIASQGPLKTTINDFWRMIWQYNVKVVAMACKLVEMGKRKCEQYWPTEDEGTMEYGDIRVTVEGEEDLAEHCTVRQLRLEKSGVARVIKQFHYTGWPDHDIPTDFDDVLEMIAQMRKIKSSDPQKSPMVVHCSAGCGRTGTICAIDFSWDMLKMGKVDESFHLYDIIKDLRDQRQSMIQTPDQYEFAHITVQKLFQKHLEMMEDHIYGNLNIAADETDLLDPDVSEIRKESVLEDDISQTINKLYDTVYPTSQDNLMPQLPEPLIPTKYQPEEKETVVSPALKDRMAVFSVEKIENIPNQKTLERKGSVEQKGSQEQPKIEAKKPSLKDSTHQPVVTHCSLDQQMPSRENSLKGNENVKIEFPSIEARKASLKAGSHSVPVNNQSSFDQQVPSRESSFKSVKAPEPPKQNLIRSESTQIDGKQKHMTVITVGGPSKIPATMSKSVPLIKQSAPLPPTAKAKTLPANPNAVTLGALKNSQSLTLSSNVGPYSYAQANQNGQAGNQTGSVGNSQFYTSDDSKSGGNTTANPQTGLQTVYPYSVVNKENNTANDTNLYSEVDKSKISKTGTFDAVYDPVQFSENEVPAIPHRGYLEPEPTHLETDKGPEETNIKKKNQLISGFKGLFSGKGSAGGGSADSSDIPGYKIRIGKQPKGPRNPPASWNKK